MARQRQLLWLIVATVTVVDCRRHRYGVHAASNGKVVKIVEASEEELLELKQRVPDQFLRELVESFKANEEAETLTLPASMSQSERQLVHIYAARKGLGHKSVGKFESNRQLVLSKDDAWVKSRRRYIQNEMSSEDPEKLVAKSEKRSGPFDSGPMQYCWLGAVAGFYTYIM